MDWMQGLEWLNKYNGAFIVLLTLMILALNVIGAFIAFGAFRENRLLRRVGSEPDVVAYLVPDDRHFLFINLVIANIGRGPAIKLRFEHDASKEDAETHRVRLLREKTFERFSVLPQGERITNFFGSGPDLLKDPPLPPVKFIIHYETADGHRRESTFLLDVKEMEGLGRIGEPAEDEIAKALTKIANAVEGWSGFRRLQVETITTAERQLQDRKTDEEIRRRHHQSPKAGG